MRIAKRDIPVRVQAPGAVARQLQDFGDATGYGAMGAEFFSLAAGTDIAPLLRGLEGDACQSPHWGYLLTGHITVSYTDRDGRNDSRGRLVLLATGPLRARRKDADIVLFSPQHEHGVVMDHLNAKLRG